jgi:hypothetical protein
MFIYPLVYTLMWLIPFIQHCTMYSDHFANHPMWFFRVGATVFITSMGFVDCLVFSVREKPWRSIQTSDGTLWGSFAVWHSPRFSSAGLNNVSVHRTDSVGLGLERMSMSAEGTAMARIRSSVRTSASDDFTRMQMERARVRLDLERDERLAALVAKIAARRASLGGVGSEGVESGESNYSGDGLEVEGGGDGIEEKYWENLGSGKRFQEKRGSGERSEEKED